MRTSIKFLAVVAVLSTIVITVLMVLRNRPSDRPEHMILPPQAHEQSLASSSGTADQPGQPRIAPLSIESRPGSGSVPTANTPTQQQTDPVSVEQRNRQANLEAAGRRMQALLKGGQADPAEVDRELAEMENANGSPILNGLNLEALRQNLQIAARMQQISKQIQAMQGASTAASGLDSTYRSELLEKTQEIQALSRQFNRNVMAADAGAESSPSHLQR